MNYTFLTPDGLGQKQITVFYRDQAYTGAEEPLPAWAHGSGVAISAGRSLYSTTETNVGVPFLSSLVRVQLEGGRNLYAVGHNVPQEVTESMVKSIVLE